MDSVRFNYGDLVILETNMHHAPCSIGYIINPRQDGRLYHGVILFGSDEIWWFKDDEMSMFNPALTIEMSEDIL